MAITDTPPTADTTGAAGDEGAAPAPDRLSALLGAGDHKTIGRLWITVSLVLGAAALVLAALWHINLIGDFLPTESVFRIFTLGRLGVVLLFLAPLAIGLGTFLVPLQVGSATIAFPRAAAMAFWMWLLSAGLLVTSYALNGGPTGGDLEGVGLTYLSLIGVVAALLLGAICIATTALALRAPKMGLDEVPLFTWSMVVTAGLWALTLPVWAGNALLVFADGYYGPATAVGEPGGVEWGVSTAQWPQLSWLFNQPQVFVFLIPVLGIIGDAVVTHAKHRQALRGVVLTAIGAFGALSFGAYAQNYFVSEVWHTWLFVGQCALLILPVLVFAGGLGSTLRAGKPTFPAPMVLAVVALLLTLLAALAAVPFGIGRLGLLHTDGVLLENQAVRDAVGGTADLSAPVYQWGVLYLVVGAATAGLVAGLFHWAPKLVGRKANDGLGKLLALGLLAGGAVAGLPMIVLGFARKADAIADAADALYGITAAGLVILAGVGLLAGLALVAKTRTTPENADPADAWGSGQTLEWATTCPPPLGNFAEEPMVSSAEPLLDDEAEADEGGED